MRTALVPIVLTALCLVGSASVEEALLVPGTGGTISAAARPFVTEREFRSPYSGHRFTAVVVSKAPPVGNYDFDFCPHPPFNTFAYSLVTDPESGWTAFPDQYGSQPPLTQTELAVILGEPKFDRNAPDGLPWLGAYPWEQFELAALQAQRLAASPLEVGNWYLQAAWSVRLDVVSGNNSFDREVEALFTALPLDSQLTIDPFLLPELRLAQQMEAAWVAGELQGIARENYALALAWLYRSRGEIQGAEHWLAEAKSAKSAIASQGSLYALLTSSISLERGYLNLAEKQLAQAWEVSPAGKSMVDSRSQGRVALIIGEIHRRLGNLASARQWYEVAARTQHGELNLDRLRHLQELASGRGY